jgi:hypothetical protein
MTLISECRIAKIFKIPMILESRRASSNLIKCYPNEEVRCDDREKVMVEA